MLNKDVISPRTSEWFIMEVYNDVCAHDPFIQVIDVGGTQTYRYCGKVISYWAGVHNYLLRWLFFLYFYF